MALLRAAATVGSYTPLSRILLFSRDVRAAAPPGGDADPVEPVSDRRAVADGALGRAGRADAGLGAVGRRRRAVPLADDVLRPGRGGPPPASAAPDRAGQTDIAADGAGRLRRRRH